MDIELTEEVIIKGESEDFPENDSASNSYVEIPELITVIQNEDGESIMQDLPIGTEQDVFSNPQYQHMAFTEHFPMEIPPLVTVVKNAHGETIVQKFIDPYEHVRNQSLRIDVSHSMPNSAKPMISATQRSKKQVTFDTEKTPHLDTCECCICKMASKGITAFNESEKNVLMKAGRPTPTLHESVSEHWQPQLYKTYPWLTRCQKSNRFYCWPCLLFQSTDKSKYIHHGYIEIQNMQPRLKAHGNLESHLNAYLKEKVTANKLAKDGINIITNEQHLDSIVVKSENVLKRLMNVIFFQAKYEVTRRGEINPQNNKSSMINLIELIASYDQSLLQELESIPSFKENIPLIYRDLEKSLFNVILKKIRMELNDAKFVSFIFVDILDSRGLNHLSAIVRYIKYVSGIPVIRERFLGYMDIKPSNRSADIMTNILSGLIMCFDCKEKIVSQSYCGATILPKQLVIVQSRLRQAYPIALPVFCTEFQMCDILVQSLSMEIDICRSFFSEIRGISELFLKYPVLVELLPTSMQINTPFSREFSGKFFKDLTKMIPFMTNIFLSVVGESELWNPDLVNSCRGYIALLEKERHFYFLLGIFADTFSLVDEVMHSIKLKPYNVIDTFHKIIDVSKELGKAKLKYKEYYSKYFVIDRRGKNESGKKRNVPNPDFKDLYDKIIENIFCQFRDQLRNYCDLKFTEYCNLKKTLPNLKDFNESLLLLMTNYTYPSIFDRDALFTQFLALHNSTVIDLNMTPEKMLIFLKESGLDVGFSEITNFIELVLTIPSSLGLNEECAVSYETIKKCVQSCADEKMALLAIEEKLISELSQNRNFYQDVYDVFISINDKVKFHFK